MTGTRDAPIEHDLRNVFTPADYDADPPADSGSEGDADTDAGEGEGGNGSADDTSDSEQIKNPELKRLSNEAAAHRIRAKKAEEALANRAFGQDRAVVQAELAQLAAQLAAIRKLRK